MSQLISLGQQHSINYTGHSIAVDGVYGPDTQANGVRCVQTACNKDYGSGLDVDGSFGPASSSALSGHYVQNGEQQELVRAVQILLYLNDFDPNGVDGSFGSGTEKAVRDFQASKGLSIDGVAGVDTITALMGTTMTAGGSSYSGRSDEWRKYDPKNLPNFGPDEFKCSCGCNSGDVCDELKCWAQIIRDHYGKPMSINSGYRCRAHNAEVGGVSNSNHCRGEAIDIWFEGINIDDVKAFVNSKGLACGTYYSSGFCHVDMDGPSGNFVGD